jgi:hypothetical protein
MINKTTLSTQNRGKNILSCIIFSFTMGLYLEVSLVTKSCNNNDYVELN